MLIADVDLTPLLTARSSAVFETERNGARTAPRPGEKTGYFGVEPLPFEREEDDGSREAVRVGAIES